MLRALLLFWEKEGTSAKRWEDERSRRPFPPFVVNGPSLQANIEIPLILPLASIAGPSFSRKGRRGY